MVQSLAIDIRIYKSRYTTLRALEFRSSGIRLFFKRIASVLVWLDGKTSEMGKTFFWGFSKYFLFGKSKHGRNDYVEKRTEAKV
jgi:hypothetical protein